MSPSTALVRKLIAVLESIEKLPVYNYDSPGAGYGLQVCMPSVICNGRIPSAQLHITSLTTSFTTCRVCLKSVVDLVNAASTCF